MLHFILVLFDVIRSIMENLGLLKKRASVIILGLENSGKTTLVHLLATDVIKIHCPSVYPSIRFRTKSILLMINVFFLVSDSFQCKNIIFTCHDIGGYY